MALSHLLDTLRPRLLTEAAHGGLKPSPTERLRRVLLHLSYSMALSHLLDTIPPRSFSLDHWWEVPFLQKRVWSPPDRSRSCWGAWKRPEDVTNVRLAKNI